MFWTDVQIYEKKIRTVEGFSKFIAYGKFDADHIVCATLRFFYCTSNKFEVKLSTLQHSRDALDPKEHNSASN